MAKGKYIAQNNPRRISMTSIKPKWEHDITCYPYTDEDMAMAKKYYEKNREKWKDDKTGNGKRQQARTPLSFLPWVIGRKLNSKFHDNVDELVASIENNISPLCCDLFSRFDYTENELRFAESRVEDYYLSGRLNFDDPSIRFTLKQLIDSELMIIKWTKRIRNMEGTIELARMQCALQKERIGYATMKLELGLMQAKITKGEQKEQEKKEKEEGENNDLQKMIKNVIKENEEGNKNIAAKIEAMRRKKADRGD